jgi:hypothetical protein
MKIYILPVHQALQPSSNAIIYPPHNDYYGLEQDFLIYLQRNENFLTDKADKADFHYLPVFWLRWNNNHNYGESEKEKLQNLISQSIIDDFKTFTVSQTSNGTLVDVGRTIVFYASRRTKLGLDLPLICKPHQFPIQLPPKEYLASFVGRLYTHSIRIEMAEYFKNIENTFIFDGNNGINFFVEMILKSYISLCPRGYGGNSYRFFESLQLGVVPFLIGDLDTRPFKKYINWDEYSFYSETVKEAAELVKNSKTDQLLTMGEKCIKLWEEKLTYGKWCGFLIKELDELKRFA